MTLILHPIGQGMVRRVGAYCWSYAWRDQAWGNSTEVHAHTGRKAQTHRHAHAYAHAYTHTSHRQFINIWHMHKTQEDEGSVHDGQGWGLTRITSHVHPLNCCPSQLRETDKHMRILDSFYEECSTMVGNGAEKAKDARADDEPGVWSLDTNIYGKSNNGIVMHHTHVWLLKCLKLRGVRTAAGSLAVVVGP